MVTNVSKCRRAPLQVPFVSTSSRPRIGGDPGGERLLGLVAPRLARRDGGPATGACADHGRGGPSWGEEQLKLYTQLLFRV